MWLITSTYKCFRSQSKGSCSLSKWMSFSSSHLDSSQCHTFSHSKPLSSEVPATRRFPTDCHHNISGFLYTHWSCSCHNVHSQSGRTNPTWIWVPLLWTHRYNWQWWDILWCMHGVTWWLWHLAKYYVTVIVFLVYSMHSICAGVWQFNSYAMLHQLFWLPRSKDSIGTCSDMLHTTVR